MLDKPTANQKSSRESYFLFSFSQTQEQIMEEKGEKEREGNRAGEEEKRRKERRGLPFSKGHHMLYTLSFIYSANN